MFTRIPFAMIQFQCRTGPHESTFCDRLRPLHTGSDPCGPDIYIVRSVYGHIYSYHFFMIRFKIKFCNIITNLTVMFVLRLFKLIW